MPFRSEKQRRFLWAKHPEIAKRWAHEYKTKKDLPMYVNAGKSDKDSDEKKAHIYNLATFYTAPRSRPDISDFAAMKKLFQKYAESSTVKIQLPKTPGPTYAGQEQTCPQQMGNTPEKPTNSANTDENTAKALLSKLAAVLSPKLLQEIEERKARKLQAQAARIPQNVNLKTYPLTSSSQIPPPMGMTPPPPQPQQQVPQQAQQQQPEQNTMAPVGSGSSPMFNPINAFGALSVDGNINGNAAFGSKNSPDSSKVAAANTPCSCGCGDTVATCKCGPDCKCRKPGGSCYKSETEKTSAWPRGVTQMFKRIFQAPAAAPKIPTPAAIPRPAVRTSIPSPLQVVSGGQSRPGTAALYVQNNQGRVPVRQFAQTHQRDRLQARKLLMQGQQVPSAIAARLRAAGHLTENPAAYSQLPANVQRDAAKVVRPMFGGGKMTFSPQRVL